MGVRFGIVGLHPMEGYVRSRTVKGVSKHPERVPRRMDDIQPVSRRCTRAKGAHPAGRGQSETAGSSAPTKIAKMYHAVRHSLHFHSQSYSRPDRVVQLEVHIQNYTRRHQRTSVPTTHARRVDLRMRRSHLRKERCRARIHGVLVRDDVMLR